MEEKLLISQIRGTAFKKDFGLHRCMFGYHNRNTKGGNFGLHFYLEEEFNPNTDFTLHGNYNKEGEITSIGVMGIRCGSFQYKFKAKTLRELKERLRQIYTELKK